TDDTHELSNLPDRDSSNDEDSQSVIFTNNNTLTNDPDSLEPFHSNPRSDASVNPFSLADQQLQNTSIDHRIQNNSPSLHEINENTHTDDLTQNPTAAEIQGDLANSDHPPITLQHKNKTAKLMADRMERKQMKLDAEVARLEAHRAERILRGDRHSERNSKRVLSSKISRSQNAFMKLLKTEGHKPWHHKNGKNGNLLSTTKLHH
ncbi:hypothetical protein GcM3_132021, partial [Golovinomyces cichoracearum]